MPTSNTPKSKLNTRNNLFSSEESA